MTFEYTGLTVYDAKNGNMLPVMLLKSNQYGMLVFLSELRSRYVKIIFEFQDDVTLFSLNS